MSRDGVILDKIVMLDKIVHVGGLMVKGEFMSVTETLLGII